MTETTERTSTAPTPTHQSVGAPVWVDLSAGDIDRSREFYTAVLGWDYTGGGEEYGGYLNATVGGKVVAGLAPPMPGADPGQTPHVWTTYLAVQDSAAAEARITAAGGTVVMPSMQVGPLGSMGIYADPTGAVFGTWQAGSHHGYELFGEPGAVAWNDVMVGDYEGGRQFYAAVFGWTYEEMTQEDIDPGEGAPEEQMDYAFFVAPGDPAGMTGGIGHEHGQEGAYWSVAFAVDGTDEAARRVRDAGGQVLVEPFDFEHGRIAICAGPDGEPFGIFTSAQEMPTA